MNKLSDVGIANHALLRHTSHATSLSGRGLSEAPGAGRPAPERPGAPSPGGSGRARNHHCTGPAPEWPGVRPDRSAGRAQVTH